ncbi:hypothetical protein PMI22_02530 [Pseudomonas sp. GM21]|jgi:hypothetical protein|uniref:DUF6124 family protein n=1 Tax=unclassified Pseudomonas TaxID=196821 RepID=UPI000272594C|nr:MULTISPECIES: DUF6124 family protein [unclassified Pseudomonas]EJM20414.1 hypothetical protein PMI22_02530 [Pseudomonas sp. GM21]MDR6926604.1 hypothetical protein [Pseudomonas sp. BE134]
MFKVTPNPPDTDPASPSESIDSKKLHDDAERALNFYLNPAALMNNTPRKPSTIFMIAPDVDHETLLVQTCENLASASVMASNVAALVEGTHRSTVLALQQVIMLGELAVNRMLDNFVPPR